MNNTDYQKKMDSMLEKVGNEAGNLILDDVGLLITDNKQMNDDLIAKDKEIENLKKMNSTLQSINGNLLQQVSMGVENPSKNQSKAPEEHQEFDFRSSFDDKGNFKR